MGQNKDQSGAAVRGEAVAESEPTGLPPISMSTYGTKTACELERLRRTQRVGPDNLPRWIDNMKGSDPTIDSLIEYIVSARAADAPSEPSESAMRAALERIARWHGEFPDVGSWPDGTKKSYGGAFGSNGEREYMRRIAHDALLAQPVDTKSGQREPQQKTIDCMDAWATSMQMPTYSELHALTEQYDALIRKICFQYAAGGYNSDGFMAPKSADLKLRWIIDEAYKSPSRAADALDSQPTVSAVLAELRADLRELANNTEAFGEYSQEAVRVAFDSATDELDEVAAKYATSQPTDGGVRNG